MNYLKREKKFKDVEDSKNNLRFSAFLTNNRYMVAPANLLAKLLPIY